MASVQALMDDGMKLKELSPPQDLNMTGFLAAAMIMVKSTDAVDDPQESTCR